MSHKVKTTVQVLMLAAAIAMLLAGSLQGEMQVVLSKAIKLCLECVGIG